SWCSPCNSTLFVGRARKLQSTGCPRGGQSQFQRLPGKSDGGNSLRRRRTRRERDDSEPVQVPDQRDPAHASRRRRVVAKHGERDAVAKPRAGSTEHLAPRDEDRIEPHEAEERRTLEDVDSNVESGANR